MSCIGCSHPDRCPPARLPAPSSPAAPSCGRGVPWVLKNVPSVRGSGMASAGVRPSPHSSTLLPTLSTAAAALGASPTEAATVSVYFRAVAALYGSILFWYGAWTQLDVGWSQDGYAWAIDRDGVNGTRENPWCVGSGLPYNPKRDGAYVLVGTAVLVLTDSLYSNAGVGSHCWSPPRLRRCAESTPGVFAVVRVFAALFGSVLLWLGWYNLVNNDLCFTQLVRRIPTVGQYLRFKFELLLSVVLLAVTSTFFAVSGVDVPAAESLATGEAQHSSLLGAVDTVNVALDKVDSDSALPAQAEAFVRATVTIFAQTLLFSGAYGVLETECWVEPCDGNVWREMFYCATGLALFFSADAFLSNSLVETDDEEQRPTSSGERETQRAEADTERGAAELPSHASLVLRCSAALTGAVMHNTGVWTILDQYLSPHWVTCSSPDGASTGRVSCQARNFGLTAAGVLLLCASGTLYSNASVSPLATLQVPSHRSNAVAQRQRRELLRARLRRAARRAHIVSSMGHTQAIKAKAPGAERRVEPAGSLQSALLQ